MIFQSPLVVGLFFSSTPLPAYVSNKRRKISGGPGGQSELGPNGPSHAGRVTRPDKLSGQDREEEMHLKKRKKLERKKTASRIGESKNGGSPRPRSAGTHPNDLDPGSEPGWEEED